MYVDIKMGMQNKTNKQQFSRLRQSLGRCTNEIKELTKPYFSDKPIIKGTVYELKRKCGKAGCKCTQGQLHGSMVVSASEKGKTKLRTIPSGFLIEVQIKVERYQEIRRYRARLVEIHKNMLQIMDEMETLRKEEVPTTKKMK